MRGLLSSRTVLPLAAAICLAPGPALATLLTGPFAGGQSWGVGVATDGTTFFIDNDGDRTPENYPVPAALKPTGPFTFSLSALPPPRFLYAFAGDPTCGGAGSARVFYYDVVQDSPTTGHLTAITNLCIPNGIAFDGYALGQQPIAFVAGTSLPADTTQTMFWINLSTGGKGSSALTRDLDHVGFPQFPPSVTVAFTRELPAMPTTATYHLVDLCPATLGSLLNPGGGMLANLSAPEPTAAVLDTGGGHFVARVSHPSLPGGSIDVALSNCLAMASTTTTTTPTSSTIASTTTTTNTTTTTLPPIVTTTDPYAPGGLLEVVARVNAGQPGPITFALPGPGPYVIDLGFSPVFVTRPMTIDGTSQSAHGAPLVQIHNGEFDIEAPGCTLQGLAIDSLIVVMPPADGTLIRNNYLGIAPDGVTRNAIGGTAVTVRTRNNTLQGNVIAGVVLIGEQAGEPPATANVVRGNRIGTNAAGTALVPASPASVEVESANNVIGGTALGDGNLIAGSVEIGSLSFPPPPSSAAGVLVAGNFLGTDVTGMVVLGRAGVHILGRSGNTSGNTVGPGNVITEEVLIQGSNGNTIKGNLIGTDVTGRKVLVSLVGGEPAPGIEVLDSSNNTIGGMAATDRNVVAGHASTIKGQGIVDGILISSLQAEARGNRVLGNFVGTDITGTLPLPNDIGVDVSNAQDTVIGGTAPGAGNLVAGNTAYGINVGGSGTAIQGNFIGTDPSGALHLGNGTGVYVQQASGTVVGGTDAGAGNLIYFNHADGVLIVSGSGNAIEGNSIDQNGCPGITLYRGANGDVTAPVLTGYTGGLISMFVGSAMGPANQPLMVEFFANPAGDGEGRTFCSRKMYTADASGRVAFRETIACPVTDASEAATGTATVTDVNGNTSEFSSVAGVVCVTTTSTIPGATTTTTLGALTIPTTTTSTTIPCRTARCILDGALAGPACHGEAVPPGVTKRLVQAERLIEEAAVSPPKKAMRLRKRAKNLLTRAAKAAGKATRGKKARLAAGCAADIQRAVDRVRGGLGV